METIEEYFSEIYNGIIGNNELFETPFGMKKICYADWAASGRLYTPIEEKISQKIGPYVANTHTETNISGKTMTYAYHEAKRIIKEHVNANSDDILLFEGTGMTGALCKLQSLLGLTVNEKYKEDVLGTENIRPVVFVTHMEHHSNQTTWTETIADVVVVPPNQYGEVCSETLDELLYDYQDRNVKIGAFTACSNVTGIQTPYHQLAKIMHKHGGICFVDFSASAPYVSMNMHPEDSCESLDGIYFSPHKFLGGPGTTGVVIFSKSLYKNDTPERPGGGTVNWTNPWGGKSYIENIEDREDGGTPGFLQAIRTALSIKLKEKMGIQLMRDKENELVRLLFEQLEINNRIIILECNKRERLPIVSFYVENVHYNLIVKLLNDVHGVQVRGGCSCAGTYGHFLLNIDENHSKTITDEIDKGNLFTKPGWVRISLHPTTRMEDVLFITDSVHDVINNINSYKNDYIYIPETNEYKHKEECYRFNKAWFEV